jgi:hypothetical protein
VKTGSLERISSCSGNAGECFISAPDWSTSNKIAYGVSIAETSTITEYDPLAGNISANYQLDAFVGERFIFGNSDVDTDVKLIRITTSSLSWSPDGIYIAIVDNNLPSNILLLNTKTRKIVNVTQSSDLSVGFDSPAWSADGQWLLLRKLRMIQYDFWEPVGYDFVLTNIPIGISKNNFQLDIIYESDSPLICPGNLVVE